MPDFKTTFETAKKFSDYLAFHVRLFFVWSIAQVAAAIPVKNMLAAFDKNVKYSAWDYKLEIAIAVLFLIYAFVMLFHIIKVGVVYINTRMRPLFGYPISAAFIMVKMIGITAILYYGTLQILRAFDLTPQVAECALQEYLAQTNYRWTPKRPDYCPPPRNR